MRRIVIASTLALVTALQAVAPVLAQEVYDYNSPFERAQRKVDLDARAHDRQLREQPTEDAVGAGLGSVILGGLILWYLANSGSSERSNQAAATDESAGRDTAEAPTQTYRVVSVPKWDVLNMRSGPGGEYGLVGSIPSRGTGVVLRTCEADQIGKAWCMASYGSQRGWVSARLLAPE